MKRLKLCVIGAGAMGSSYGGLLAKLGHEVLLVDRWSAHVEAINRDGLQLDGVCGQHRLALTACQEVPDGLDADLAMIWTDTNNTRQAALIAERALAAGGFAVTLQNGVQC